MATSGALHLEVIEARLTRDTSSWTGMDPYVQIKYRMEEHKTTPKEGKNPEWNEAFDIDVKYVGDDMIIVVWDKCSEGDDKVGETNIKASSLCSGTGIDDWFPLLYKGKAVGQLHLKSTWSPGGAA